MLTWASYRTKQRVPKRSSNTQHNSKPHQQSLQEGLPYFSLPIQTLKEKPLSVAGISLINNQLQNLNELTTANTQTKSYTQTTPSSPTNTQDSSQLCKNTQLEYHKNIDAKDSFIQLLSRIHTLFTPFESMLFEFNQEEDLDKSHQTILQLLRTATLRRYKLFTPTNLSYAICDKCDMCLSDINWIKSTKKTCKKM